jgi:hypothetical protein
MKGRLRQETYLFANGDRLCSESNGGGLFDYYSDNNRNEKRDTIGSGILQLLEAEAM